MLKTKQTNNQKQNKDKNKTKQAAGSIQKD